MSDTTEMSVLNLNAYSATLFEYNMWKIIFKHYTLLCSCCKHRFYVLIPYSCFEHFWCLKPVFLYKLLTFSVHKWTCKGVFRTISKLTLTDKRWSIIEKFEGMENIVLRSKVLSFKSLSHCFGCIQLSGPRRNYVGDVSLSKQKS